MAQLLQADGEDVRLLAFLDTFCPVKPKRSGLRLGGRLRWRPSWWPGSEFAWKRAKISWQTRHGEPVPHDLREFALYDSFLTAQEKYKPRVYSGSVQLWLAEEMDPALAWIGSDLGWEPYIEGGLDIHQIPGTHQTLVLEPSVELLVAELRDALDTAGAAAHLGVAA